MIRIGIGYDIHRLVEGRVLILGGVTIPHEKGFEAHSDGDVLVHAVIDALLGAAALGGIGRRFPDTDPRYKDADSMALLSEVAGLLSGEGHSIVNIDADVIAQQPRLDPHIDAMRERLAAALGLDLSSVSVKAKTNEGLGPEGRGEAISAQSVVLIESP